ncbi:MAG: transcription termination/antitermination protein NusA, partial [Treponema sp.]|nr:transcription termination/antitermination protein NusA [Treponema sp.]
LSLAIGKQGLNVRLANRLADWNIDVKTDSQFAEMDITAESRRAVSELFGDDYSDEISRVSELPGVDSQVAQALLDHGIEFIEDFLALSEEELAAITAVSPEQFETLRKLIEEYVEIVEEEEEPEKTGEFPGQTGEEEQEQGEEAGEEAEEYECPECGAKITVDMTNCPNCGIGLSFEYEE